LNEQSSLDAQFRLVRPGRVRLVACGLAGERLAGGRSNLPGSGCCLFLSLWARFLMTMIVASIATSQARDSAEISAGDWRFIHRGYQKREPPGVRIITAPAHSKTTPGSGWNILRAARRA
jgi:hypothetical protein